MRFCSLGRYNETVYMIKWQGMIFMHWSVHQYEFQRTYQWIFSAKLKLDVITDSCGSEPPTRWFLCARTRHNLNLFLEWGSPLKWSHLKQKTGHRLPYINHPYKGLHHTSIKIYDSKLRSYQVQMMVRSFVLISSDLAPSSKIQNRFAMSHVPIVMSLSHDIALWFGYQVIVKG